VVRIKPLPLEPLERTTLLMRKDTVWVPKSFWPFETIEKYLAIVGLSIADSPAGSLVSMPNKIPRLLLYRNILI
jgi:hypothetical protein